MAKHIIEYDEKCKSCGGSGLYVGMAERDGAAVVCSTCKGTGCHHVKLTYEDFEGRQNRKDVKRVYQVNPGIMLGGKTLAEFGGVTYEQWLNQSEFPFNTENRKYICPAWWYQSADYEKKPKWENCLVC